MSAHQNKDFLEETNLVVEALESSDVILSLIILSANIFTKNLPEKSCPSLFSFLVTEKVKSWCSLALLVSCAAKAASSLLIASSSFNLYKVLSI